MAYEIMFLVSSIGLALLVFAFVCYLKCCSSNAAGEGGERGYFADDPARIPARGNVANLFMQNNNKHNNNNNNTVSPGTTDSNRPTSEKEAAGRGGGDLSDAELSQMFQPYVSRCRL
ncbi:hypothetical protein TYRP_006072 [Tyrophagus putrescentiae]|nr:hypothetical protein TYRP_006072 [Tyrophagus putrescentiae]